MKIINKKGVKLLPVGKLPIYTPADYFVLVSFDF